MDPLLSDLDRLGGQVLSSLENDTLASPIFGEVDFRQIKDNLDRFRQKFMERQSAEWEIHAVNACYEALADPLARLDEFFQNIQGQAFDIEERRAAYYVASTLMREIEELRDVARQLDEG